MTRSDARKERSISPGLRELLGLTRELRLRRPNTPYCLVKSQNLSLLCPESQSRHLAESVALQEMIDAKGQPFDGGGGSRGVVPSPAMAADAKAMNRAGHP
jgi:hypothetical protein